MPLTNYGELKTEVARYLVRDDLTNAIPDFIRLGEARIETDLRIRLLEASANVTIVASTNFTVLPAGWLEGRDVYIQGPPVTRLEYRSPAEYRSIWEPQTPARPKVYTVIGENFLWGPVPDTGYTAVTDYYQQLPILVNDADTTALFTKSPGLYLYSALIESAPFLGNDARVQIWSSLYEDTLERLKRADMADRYSGDAIPPSRAAQAT